MITQISGSDMLLLNECLCRRISEHALDRIADNLLEASAAAIWSTARTLVKANWPASYAWSIIVASASTLRTVSATVLRRARVCFTCLVHFDRNRYSVP